MSEKELGNVDLASDSDVGSLQNDAFSIKERLKVCFKPTYRMRKLKNKGAILVLAWGFLLISVYYYIDYQSLNTSELNETAFYAIQSSVCFVMPLAGWLADVYFGRHRVLHWSTWIMWIVTVVITVSSILAVEYENAYKSIHKDVFMALLIVLGLGYGCFQANVVQFGVDQLTDASTNELIAFIHWHTCAILSSGVVCYLAPECTGLSHEYKSLFVPFLLCVFVSAIAVSMFLFDKVLIKEPTTKNPFKIIYRVVKYATKNKYPQRRSAFTYCEDDIPSRLDLGKRKYGGPFTTEQVEDVKTFFRMLGLIFIVGAVFGITEEKILKLDLHEAVEGQVANKISTKCLSSFIFTNIYYVTGALLIPLNEFLFNPIFHRCIPNIKCYWKCLLGVVLHLGRYVVLIVLVAVANYRYVKVYGSQFENETSQSCLFLNSSAQLIDTIDYRWFSASEFMSAISFIFIIVGAVEFYCAQVPYSMKGLVAGLLFASFMLFRILNNVLPSLFSIEAFHGHDQLGTILGCGFWYLLTKFIFLLIVSALLLVILKYYKMRIRDDVLPNQHIFAERYYDSDNT